MRAWRKIVSVLAGTMIAVGGIVGTIAVLEAVGPAPSAPSVSEGAAGGGFLFDSSAATQAVTSDLGVVSQWLNQSATAGAPPDSQTSYDAALAAWAISEVADPSNNTAFSGVRSAPGSTEAAAQGSRSVGDASTIVADTPDIATGGARQSAAAVTTLYAAGAAESFSLHAYFDAVSGAAPFANHTPLANASEVLAAAPTSDVALLATAPAPAAEHANWSAAATEEIVARAGMSLIGEDDVALALASQALRAEEPSTADTLNAELRSRQGTDGSLGGDVKATAEAARALALGTSASDRISSARAIEWLDAQGTLSPQEAVYRLRAHASDPALSAAAMDRVYPPTAAEGAAVGLGGTAGKGVLALLFLGGGIGLSLTLVTDDALKGSRRRLYDTIRSDPGLHVNELRRRLRMSPSSIEYHLSVLVGAGLVVSEEDGRYKRFYANGAGLGLNPGSPNSRNTLGALRRPHAVEIVQHLLERGSATAREVSRSLSLHESAASRRLDHLERSGVLVSERAGRERRYQVRERQAAIKALTLVEASPAPGAADATADAAPERGPSDGMPAPAMTP